MDIESRGKLTKDEFLKLLQKSNLKNKFLLRVMVKFKTSLLITK